MKNAYYDVLSIYHTCQRAQDEVNFECKRYGERVGICLAYENKIHVLYYYFFFCSLFYGVVTERKKITLEKNVLV